MSLSSSARRILCMSVGRRSPIRGSVRSLSTTEGKFRVKGSGRGRQRAALILYCNAAQINEGGHIPHPRYVPAFLRVFSLGRTDVIIDNGSSQKLRFYGRNGVPRAADSRDSARR